MWRRYYTGFSNIKPKDAPAISPVDMIKNEFRGGSIDEHTKILLYLYSMFDKSQLPREYTELAPVKSGTTIIEEIFRYIRRRDAKREIVDKARAYLASAVPKLEKEYASPSGYFRIHYTLRGTNAVPLDDFNRNGIPDYIESIGEAFDHIKAFTCDSRKFRTPIMDAGQTAIDINVYNLDGKYGMTFPQKFYTSINGPRTSSSFISIDNNYSHDKGFKEFRDDCMRVTAAHEFFHAVQNSYNADADSWWKEASATWNEDEVYDGINDYIQYLGKIMSSPEMSLDESSYGGVIFAKYLSEHWGGYETVKSIWEHQSTRFRNSINAIDSAISARFRSEGIGTIFNRFTACNFNPPQFYSEGYLWKYKVAIRNTISQFPVENMSGKLSHLSTSYEMFKPNDGSDRKLKISIKCTGKIKWGFKIIRKKRFETNYEIVDIPVNPKSGTAEYTCEGFGGMFDEVCLAPANLEKTYDGAVYTYSASVE